tara:strand:+ start:5619 stop:6560 length:942 start_codon:yes stop_codon:yes gene_type:complete
MEGTMANTVAKPGAARAAPAEKAPDKGGMARLSPALRAVALASRALDTLAPEVTARLMLRHFHRPRSRYRYDYRRLLPPGAERLRLRYRDLDLTGWRWGRQGPAALLVHGWEDHSGSMLPLVAPLRHRGYQVFALDAPGHGLSANAATHLLDCSRALELMVRTHGPFESIVGHSFGATAAAILLSRVPTLCPQRMTMVSPMRDIEQHLEVFADIALLSPARTARLRRLLISTLGEPLSSLSATAAAGRLRIPGLVIHDRHDPVIPHSVGATVARNWAGARLVSTRHLGHRGVLKSPQVVTEILGFHDRRKPTC